MERKKLTSIEPHWNKGLPISTMKNWTPSKKSFTKNQILNQWCKDKYDLLMKNRTPEEILMLSLLPGNMKRHAIPQLPIYVDNRIYFVDLFVRKYNIIIEVDGGYHSTMAQKEKDIKRDSSLGYLGLRVYRISNHHLHDEMECRKIKQMLSRIMTIRATHKISDIERDYLSNVSIIEKMIQNNTFLPTRKMKYAVGKAKRVKSDYKK